MVLSSLSSLVVIFRARREERLLAEEFGEEWQRYRRDVPGWLPTLRKRVK
jgi:protein-S-isoprenylcysteine O-methyltransferase Ste14